MSGRVDKAQWLANSELSSITSNRDWSVRNIFGRVDIFRPVGQSHGPVPSARKHVPCDADDPCPPPVGAQIAELTRLFGRVDLARPVGRFHGSVPSAEKQSARDPDDHALRKRAPSFQSRQPHAGRIAARPWRDPGTPASPRTAGGQPGVSPSARLGAAGLPAWKTRCAVNADCPPLDEVDIDRPACLPLLHPSNVRAEPQAPTVRECLRVRAE